MIFGIGCDLCSIKRIEKAMQRLPFEKHVFTDKESAYACMHGVCKQASLAACFAAKEAVLKAFGTGLRKGKLTDIEVVHDELGKPQINLYGYYRQLADDKLISNIQLSLTHEGDMAGAFVVVEAKQ